jgi:DNA-directed RNA polymerase beta subunit
LGGDSVTSNVKNKRTSTTGAESGISEIQYHLDFRASSLQKPVVQESLELREEKKDIAGSTPVDAMLPVMARRLMRTYSAQIRVDADISATAFYEHGKPETKTATVVGCRVGGIPVMIQSTLCHLDRMSCQQLIEHQEDPHDEGGYFIIHGGEHSIDCIENTTSNDMRITIEPHRKETARVQILSKFGDGFENSYQFIIRRMSNGAITVEPQFFSLRDIQFPFNIFFRLIADIDDKTIAEYIIGDTTGHDALTTAMVSMLSAAFTAPVEHKYSQLRYETKHKVVVETVGKNLLEISQSVLAQRDDDVMRAVHDRMMTQVDKQVLPHLGQKDTDRVKKLRYIGYAIHKMFLTVLGVLNPLDRDSLCTKRIHAAGIAISKSFKSMFSRTVTTPIRRQLNKAFESSPFAQVSLPAAVASAIKPNDLENAMTKSMTVGNTEIQIGRTHSMNRVSSQTRYLKNDLNARAIANNIAVANVLSNKQTDRADQIRRAHTTYVGYIDMAQSADTGEKVGMNKQMAVSAIISLASSSDNLKQAIIKEEGARLISINDARSSVTNIRSEHLSYLFVNGDWIGCIERDWEFVARWRYYRRHSGGFSEVPSEGSEDVPPVHRHTTIFWDSGCREVRIWTDYGRMLRPLIIVYNNLEDYNKRCLAAKAAGAPAPDKSEFKQWTLLSRDIIAKFMRGEIGMQELQRDGIIEYISADESENTFIAPSIGELRSRRRDICSRFTHCDIGQAIHGIVTLAAPLTNHSYGIRTTYFDNQRKQACAWFSLAYPYRSDKKTMMQYYCEKPLVSCFTDDFVNPNGHNCMVAIMVHTGYNQEDSMFINAGSVQRGMFNGSFFDYETTVCEHGEMFAMPENHTIIDRHSNAITDFLDGGVARVGTILRRDYVMIHKVAMVTAEPGASKRDERGSDRGSDRGAEAQKFIDRSIVYSSRTPAYVTEVTRGDDERKMHFIRVKYRQMKNIIRGDKCSSRTGNKGIVSRIIADCDMPYTEDGLRPDIVVNPQSIPTRRALNQIIESVLGQYGAVMGCRVDATSLLPVDINAVISALEERGFQHVGYKRMYNGMTGDWLDLPICIGPTTYQRLEKFVDNECRAVRHGPVDTVTRQPVRGGIERGALRLGEMESATMIGHGAMRSFAEKVVTDADGTITYVCKRCGNVAVYNPRVKLYSCKTCGQFAQIVAVPTTWSANLLREEIRTLGVKMQLEVEPHSYFQSETSDTQ